MRPAQRALARAVQPPAEHAVHMRQATVVTPWSNAATSLPPPLFSDTFQRPDAHVGNTDGGTGGTRQWLFDTYASYGFDVVSDALTTTGINTGQQYAACSINLENQGGTSQATIARLGTGAMGIHVRAASYLGYQFFLVAVPGVGYTDDGVHTFGPVPAIGDVLLIEDTLTVIRLFVNNVNVANIDDRYYGASAWAASLNNYYGGILSDTHQPSGMGLRDWSYTAPGTVGTSTSSADVEVDFGDGVSVACPRASTCPPLLVGDLVLVLREHHTNVVIDKITPLGDS